MSTYANVYVKSIFIGPRSIAGVPLSQAAPSYLITAHHLCAFLLYLARQQCGGFPKRKKLGHGGASRDLQVYRTFMSFPLSLTVSHLSVGTYGTGLP